MYVDEDLRDNVIPKGTQQVEIYHDTLKLLDEFETSQIDESGIQGNPYVQKILSKRPERKQLSL